MTLHRHQLDDDPIEQVLRWWAEAEHEAEMVVATVDAEGAPTARYVLLRGIDHRGFVFHTDRRSSKGAHLTLDPRAALVCRWAPNRQVRVTGQVSELPDDESDAYFATRPRGSQLGAWASRQSHVIPDRRWLEDRVVAAAERFGDQSVPRPPYWGGYLVRPEVVELWQHGDDRLHDRFRYERVAESWRIERLAP